MSEETVTAPETEEAAEKKKTRRLTKAQWAEIKELYELGQATASELAARFDVSVQALSQYFKRHGIKAGSRAHEVAKKVAASVTEASAEGASEFVTERRKRIEETKTEHYKMQSTLDKMIFNLAIKAAKEGVPVSTYLEDVKTYRQMKAALAIGRHERYVVLDAEGEIDQKELPELVIRELTDNEVVEIRNRTEDDDFAVELEELPGDVADDDIVVEGEDE